MSIGVARTMGGSMFVFRGVQNTDVLSAASRDGFAAARKINASHPINVFSVEEYESNGKTGKKWTRIGAAFPHKEGLGFSIELKAFPIDGRLVVLPPDLDDSSTRNGK